MVFLSKEKPESNRDETSDKLKWKNTERNKFAFFKRADVLKPRRERAGREGAHAAAGWAGPEQEQRLGVTGGAAGGAAVTVHRAPTRMRYGRRRPS